MVLLFSKSLNHLRTVSLSLYEAKTIKDKLIILQYYLKTPLFLINHITGKKNSPFLNSDVTIKNKWGTFFCGNNKYSFLGFSSFSDPDVRREMMKFKRGTVIDVGANGGMHTIPTARNLGKNGKVFAIEPEPRNFSILKKNVDLNGLENVFCMNVACYKSEGKLKLHLDKDGPGGHSLLVETPIEKKGYITVKTRKLDNLVAENKIKDIRLIKIDVEGAEADVLIGAKNTLKRYHPKIIFEAWSEEHFEKIKVVLDKNNYKYKKIGTQDYLAY